MHPKPPHILSLLTLWALLCLASTQPLLASRYVWDGTTDSLYHTAISLKLKPMRKALQAQGYDNFNHYLIEDYLEFLEVFLSEDERVYERFAEGQERRFAALKKGDGKSPWHQYVQAEMHLHNALASLRMKSFYTAFISCRKAWKLYNTNHERFPGFKPNLKGIATLQAIMGIIPQQYQWGVSMLGLEGNLKKGMETLRQLSETPFEFRTESMLIYASLLIHLEGKHEEAWLALQQGGYPVKGNLFTYYTAANAAIYSKHNEAALHILATRPKGQGYAPFPMMEYLHGLAFINSLDTNCRMYFKEYLAQSRQQNNVKNTWQKLAWSYLMEGDTAGYRQGMEQVKIKGLMELDADKQAQKEAETGLVPDVGLLKARLLFDGGYFDEALAIVHDKTPMDYTTKPQQLELVYRKGRIYDALGRQAEAITSYQETIRLGEREPLYFAANAALNLGFIYEKVHDKTQARKYYNLCLQLKDHEYYTGLSQKAKAGLERLR